MLVDEPAGDEYSQIRSVLFSEIVMVGDTWSQYQELFLSSKETLGLLNAHAPWFFATVQQAYMSQIVLMISRITDGAGTGSRLNVSLEALLDDPRVDERPGLREQLQKRIEAVRVEADPIRSRRNKAIAHHDRAVALGEAELPSLVYATIRRVIAELGEIHNLYGAQVLDVGSDYELRPSGSVELLLEALQIAPPRGERALDEEARDLAQLRLARKGRAL